LTSGSATDLRGLGRRLGPGLSAPAALHVGAEVEDEGEDDDEPLEAPDAVWAGAPHHRVGKRGPGQQEEAEEGNEPALEGAAEEVAEEPEREERQAGRDQGEEDDEAADAPTLPVRRDEMGTGRDPQAALAVMERLETVCKVGGDP
jgi:hypothetical protein